MNAGCRFDGAASGAASPPRDPELRDSAVLTEYDFRAVVAASPGPAIPAGFSTGAPFAYLPLLTVVNVSPGVVTGLEKVGVPDTGSFEICWLDAWVPCPAKAETGASNGKFS